MFSHELNTAALNDPQPGDYWHEMFCPYFIVVHVSGDKITVLSCLDPDPVQNARIEEEGGWRFDYSKGIVVDKEWIKRQVTYQTFDGFCANVVRSEKTRNTANQWVKFQTDLLLKQIQELGPIATVHMLNR